MVKIDFEDNCAGSNLNILLNKNIFLNGKVCRTLLWVNQNSTPQCTQCLWWGHSRVSCQTNFSYCTICAGRHMTSDHANSRLWGEASKYALACINCLAAGMTHNHKATDHLCPFFVECNNKKNITSLLATICTRQLEGYENPFGLTKVRHPSDSDYDSSATSKRHIARSGNYPTQFLATTTTASSQSSSALLQLASSSDLLFHNVPDISHSQAMRVSTIESQANITSL